ncbi:MAG: hypothetical protein AABZ60_15550 [Planctomycetota bacterium]
MMANSFRTIQDILDASRRGDSLYSIYQGLEQSEALLKERQKNAFELLFEILIPSLTEDQAQELSRFPIESLEIYATNISIPIAQAISLYKGDKLFFKGVKQLNAILAKALAQWQGNGLYLDGVQQLDKATTKALAQWQGKWLYLNELKQLDEATAKALVHWQGEVLDLNGLQKLDEATAKALAQYKGKIYTTYSISEQINKFK